VCLTTFNFYWLHSFRLVRVRLRCTRGRGKILGRLGNKFLINFAVLAIRRRFISTSVDRCLSSRVVFKSDDKSLIGGALRNGILRFTKFYARYRSVISILMMPHARYKCG